MGSRSRSQTSTTSVQDIDTTSVGIQDAEADQILAAGGDIELTQTVTDQGAVQGAFEFAEEFGSAGFDFGADIARQAGETAREAVEVSRQAIGTVATQGATDLAGINSRTIGFIVAGVAALFIIPQVLRRA